MQIDVNFHCVKEGKCHREGLCIGWKEHAFICPFLRIYCPSRRFEEKSEV